MLRPTVFVVVLVLHLAILALLSTASRTLSPSGTTAGAIQLLFLTPVKPPKVIAENNRPARLSTNITIPAPDVTVTLSAQVGAPSTGASSMGDGHGSGVNWIAEAHRAVRAFEIRGNQTHNSALSVSSTLDERGFGEHHAGDKSKTESGDWIVWVNADCYQIASWHSGSSVDAVSPQMICRKKSAAHGD